MLNLFEVQIRQESLFLDTDYKSVMSADNTISEINSLFSISHYV